MKADTICCCCISKCMTEKALHATQMHTHTHTHTQEKLHLVWVGQVLISKIETIFLYRVDMDGHMLFLNLIIMQHKLKLKVDSICL